MKPGRQKSIDQWVEDHRTCTHPRLEEEIEILKETTNNLSDWNHRQEVTIKAQEAKIKELEGQIKDKFDSVEMRMHNGAEDHTENFKLTKSLTERLERLEGRKRLPLHDDEIDATFGELQGRVKGLEKYTCTSGHNIIFDRLEKLEREADEIRAVFGERLDMHYDRLTAIETKKPNPQPNPEDRPDDDGLYVSSIALAKLRLVERARTLVYRHLFDHVNKAQMDVVIEALDIATNSLKGGVE